jgi:tRNA(fMet)-specific endonuclease VapC
VDRRVIVDTSVIVAAERGQLNLHKVVGDDNPAIASITATEILVGVERSKPPFRDLRALHVEAMLSVFPREDYTLEIARLHAHLIKHTNQIGRPRGAFDLIIAATAGATGRTLISIDGAADFADLPGVIAETVSIN